MSIDVKASIEIARSPEAVAEVMFNPKMDTIWIRGLSNVFPMQAGLYSKGNNIERVGVFLKKAYSAKAVVTNVKEGEAVELYSDEPFEMKIKYQLAKNENGTKVTYSIASIAEVPFNQPPKVLNEMVSEMMSSDLAKLKQFIEQN